ncbi:MAG: glycoside hydrolase family 38 C-terminal domain-containing protein, partial [Candidatus Zixiibacteriota bacterium]
AYVSEIKGDLSKDTAWINTAQRQGDTSGLYAAYMYFGTGDSGGSPDSASVDWLSKSIYSDGPLQVTSVGADDVVNLVRTADRDKLPMYDGELIMTRHGTGCYTSQATMKRWNRKNEMLADATERASVIAYILGGQQYPRDMLRDTWIRFLWHQFHDDLTGTSIPEAYEYSWNDEILCQNRFSAMLTKAVQTAAAALDTRVDGIPLVVYNPLAIPNSGVIEATVYMPETKPEYVRLFSGDKEYPCDIVSRSDDSLHIRFLADAPPIGYVVYDLRPSEAPSPLLSTLSVSPKKLENERYRVKINKKGEVSSIYDKKMSKELLSEPIRYEFLQNTPLRWPAWEIDYDDIIAKPLKMFVGKPGIQVLENGLASVAVEIKQQTENSIFRTIVRLSSGAAADLVEFETDIDWYEREKLLKLAVSTKAPNDSAVYDIGLGVMKRGLNFEKRYEVPGQKWADLTSKDGKYGVAVINDSKYGWDHPDLKTLRLTLIHTPGVTEDWDWVGDERTQDNGHHKIKFAIQGHKSDWREGGVAWQAERLNQPLTAYQTTPHDGLLKSNNYSFIKSIGDPSVMINSIKLAEDSDEIIVRVRELNGISHDKVSLSFNRSALSAREVNGQEEEIGPVDIKQGGIEFALSPFQPKAFALKLEPIGASLPQLITKTVDLPFNIDGISTDDARCDGDFDGHGYTLAGDLLPDTLDYLDIPFVFGPQNDSSFNTVQCNGQNVTLPEGDFNHLYLIAASVDGPAEAVFAVDNVKSKVSILDYADPIGQWNNRLSDGELVDSPERIAPSYINRMPVAWYASHRHTPDCENDIYRFTYLYLIDLKISSGAKNLILPANDRIRVMAATLVKTPYDETNPAEPLYDETHNSIVEIAADSTAFAGQAIISINSPIPGSTIHYTLDGSEPTDASALYAGPITVSASTTVNARAFKNGFNNDYVAAKTVNKLELRDAMDIADLTNGLECKYYEAEWERLPDFDSAEAVDTFVVDTFIADTIAIPERARDEDYGLTFKGYVKVPVDGVYAFSINSDDGSRLFVCDTMLVDNDGLHSDYEMTGLIGLKAGYHPITALMFQCKGGKALGSSITGPSLPKQPIPAEMLYHKK